MTGPVFVDTNVFVYARDARDAVRHKRAAAWLAYLWQEALGRTSIQVLSECYAVLTRKLTPRIACDEAWDDITALLAWSPQAVDRVLLERAREIERRHRLSWWDSMVVGAAQLQGCALLLTEDLQDGAFYGDVRVRSPFTLEVRESGADHTATRVIAPRHRPRGRPKRAFATPPP